MNDTWNPATLTGYSQPLARGVESPSSRRRGRADGPARPAEALTAADADGAGGWPWSVARGGGTS